MKTKKKKKAAKRQGFLKTAIAKVRPTMRGQVLKALEQAVTPAFIKAAAAKIPDQITGGNFGETRGESRFSPGRWVMRNGSIAVIVEPVTLKFGVDGRQTWQGWKGHLADHPQGEGLVWGLDGKRSDATPQHEHDLLQRAKSKGKK